MFLQPTHPEKGYRKDTGEQPQRQDAYPNIPRLRAERRVEDETETKNTERRPSQENDRCPHDARAWYVRRRAIFTDTRIRAGIYLPTDTNNDVKRERDEKVFLHCIVLESTGEPFTAFQGVDRI